MEHRIAALALVLALTAAFPACAARSERRPGAEAASLTSRVEAYWNRREAKDLGGAYAFYCSAYRKRVPQAEFLRLSRLTRFDLQDIRVVPPTETGSRVQVTVSFRFINPFISAEAIEAHTTDWWTRDTDQQWCKEDEPLALPFPRSIPPGTSGS